MQQYFYQLADHVQTQLRGGERYTLWLSGEASQFIRFNHGRVRQSGQVRQWYLSLRLVQGYRHVHASISLSADFDNDRQLLAAELLRLRDALTDVAEDPHLLLADEVHSTERIEASRLPPAEAMVEEIVSAAARYDLVGFLAAGPVCHGFASSEGQRNWHETASFHFDWSLYAGGDKAVKHSYAGFDWQREGMEAAIHQSASQLELLQRPARTIAPGSYRSYLTPSALGEVLDTLNWGGFSEKELQAKRSPLLRLREGSARLSPLVSLAEVSAGGLAPAFQHEGFLRPDSTPLIKSGRYAGSLISPRTAREYRLTTNGANASEAPESLQMAAGELPVSQALEALDTGLYISNLWYLNYSDRTACRLTGMTRFASFWVEGGKIVAPLNVMRFDDSLYRMLGDNLLALTEEREFLPNAATYGERSTSSLLLPGALLKGLEFVL